MTRQEFNKLKNFKLNEYELNGTQIYRIENIEIINKDLMQKVDELTTFIKSIYKGAKAIIHCITSGTHTNHSYHYKGLAIDLHFTEIPLFEAVVYSMMYGFSGVGFYPYSEHPFLHLDIGIARRPLLWYRDEDNIYHFPPESISKLKVLA